MKYTILLLTLFLISSIPAVSYAEYFLPALEGTYPDSVYEVYSTGNEPRSICTLPSGDYLYLAIGYGYVPVFKTSDYSLEAFISVGDSPRDICALPSGEYVYLTDDSENSIYVIETATNTVSGQIEIPYLPQWIDVLPDGSKIYVTHPTGHVTVIDTETNTIETTVWAGDYPSGIAVHPGGDYVYISDKNSAYATVIETSDNSTSRFFVGGDTYDVCILPSGEYLYLNIKEWNLISVIRTSDFSILSEITYPGSDSNRFCSLPSGEYIYIPDPDEDLLHVLRTLDNTFMTPVLVFGSPDGLCTSPDGSFLYEVNSGSNDMGVVGYSGTGIETASPENSVSVTACPNPCIGTQAELFVTLPGNAITVLQIFSIDGRIQSEFDLSGNETEIYVLISDLAPGIYLSRLQSDTAVITSQFVILAD